MKKFIAILAGVSVLVGASLAQEYKSRQPYPNETTRIAGLSKYAQDTYLQLTTPKVVTSSPYSATNYNDGLLILHGAAGTINVALPNPTNNVGRRYQVSCVVPVAGLLTNSGAGWKFFNLVTGGNDNGVAIASNKTCMVFSTGTNWAAFVH